MWVFGYGSLMWDDWEHQFQGVKHNHARLIDFQRSFNKRSTVNWGTSQDPCPTLGLEPAPGLSCVGCAFEFDDNLQSTIITFLEGREGPSFTLTASDIELENGQVVSAIVPVNQRNYTYLGNLTLADRILLVEPAAGTDGNCADYIDNIYRQLEQLGIDDQAVREMWEALHQ